MSVLLVGDYMITSKDKINIKKKIFTRQPLSVEPRLKIYKIENR